MPDETFDDPDSHEVTVPDDTDGADVTLHGAQGGDAEATGGEGGEASGTIDVQPGQTLHVYVGGAGSRGSGGFNGGADTSDSDRSDAGGGGGGASDIRLSEDTLDDRVIVAAGGGGGSGGQENCVDGGDGGGDTGEDGKIGGMDSAATGGTQSAGGDGGTMSSAGMSSHEDGSDGSFGDGGEAGWYGGGGGGGWYGGGGGAAYEYDDSDDGGSGAGGSCYVDDDTVVLGSVSRGGNTGDGSVEITWVSGPDAPTVTIEDVDADAITLEWDAVSDAEEYTIYRAESSGSSLDDYSAIETTSSTSYTDDGWEHGERYYYRVTSVDADGLAGVPSDEVDATTTLPAPTDLTVDGVSDASIDLSWTAYHSDGDTRVEYRRTDETDEWSEFDVVDRETESETVDGLRNGEKYDLSVVAQTDHRERRNLDLLTVETDETVTLSTVETHDGVEIEQDGTLDIEQDAGIEFTET